MHKGIPSASETSTPPGKSPMTVTDLFSLSPRAETPTSLLPFGAPLLPAASPEVCPPLQYPSVRASDPIINYSYFGNQCYLNTEQDRCQRCGKQKQRLHNRKREGQRLPPSPASPAPCKPAHQPAHTPGYLPAHHAHPHHVTSCLPESENTRRPPAPLPPAPPRPTRGCTGTAEAAPWRPECSPSGAILCHPGGACPACGAAPCTFPSRDPPVSPPSYAADAKRCPLPG